MKNLTIFLLTIFSHLYLSNTHITDPPAKNNLKVYIADDGTMGHSFQNYHAYNKSNTMSITFTARFHTDGQYPTSWDQVITLKPNENRIVCAARYEGSQNSVFYELVEAHYSN